jgi:cytochrome b subunit of formate dehydrogenase
MKRWMLLLLVAVSWLFLIAAAYYQTPGSSGSPPQTALFNDANFTARMVPFIIALGILVGIYEARKVFRNGSDQVVNDSVRRHDSSVIILHWMNAFGLIVGLVSGAIVLRWVNNRPDQLRPIFIIHYLGASLVLFAIFAHLTRQGVSGGIGLIPKSLGVIRDLIGELFGYLGVFGPDDAVVHIPWPGAIRKPIARYVKALLGYKESNTGKYLATEQTLSYPPWAILIGIIVVTGLIKMLRYVYPLPNTLIATITTIHDLAAIGIGLMLVIHLLPLLLVPANWPLLLSIFRTTVPLDYVKKRHPGWYRQLTGKTAQEPLIVKEPAMEEGQPGHGTVESTSAD